MPGMTVDADIVTGEKSILGYLLKPIQVAVHNAMTEQ
jgi:HlyD family secretion protein/adhesin transport system membrane fusion protein